MKGCFNRIGTRALWLVAALALLAGCASIPLSTALRLSSLDAEDVAGINPSGVVVQVSLPKGFELDVAGTRLGLTLEDEAGATRTAQMGLVLRQQVSGSRPGGFFAGDIPVQTYVMALSDEGANQLANVQRSLRINEPSSLQFTVEAPLSRTPADAESMTFWTDLRLAPGEPWLHLVDAATIRFERE